MSFESKKELEMDKFNIKSHLNTSLEAEGISMSEDLVNRTLNAIRLNEEKDMNMGMDNSETRKPVFRFRYTRSLIMVAAAALILVVGLNAIRMYSPLGMKGDMMKSENSTSYDDAGTTEMYSIKEDAAKRNQIAYDMDEAKEFKADMDIASTIDNGDERDELEENDKVDMLMQGLEEESSQGGKIDDRMIDSEAFILSFNNITFLEPNDISSIMITSETTGEMSIITDNEQIEHFYSVMEKHLFTNGNEGDKDIIYQVILSSENGERQISIGESSITVTYSQDGESLNNIYIADDHDKLLKDYKELFTN